MRVENDLPLDVWTLFSYLLVYNDKNANEVNLDTIIFDSTISY